MDPQALVETFAVSLVVPTVCLFKAGLLRGSRPWSQVFVIEFSIKIDLFGSLC